MGEIHHSNRFYYIHHLYEIYYKLFQLLVHTNAGMTSPFIYSKVEDLILSQQVILY